MAWRRQLPFTLIQARPPAVLRYGAAVLSIVVALLLTFLLDRALEQNQYMLFALAVMFASWYGGLGPGLLATVLATITVNYYFIQPRHWLDLGGDDFSRLGVFVVVALAINWLNESRLRAQRHLRHSEDHFRSLVEGVEDYAIFLLDPQGTVLTWNAGAERTAGFSSDEIIGRHYGTLFLPEDARVGKPQRLLAIAAAEGRVEEEDWRVRRDGSRYWAGIIITALRDEDGNIRGYAKITRDLTERREAEELARQRQSELAHMSRLTTMSELATGIAHELNQPLSAIAIYSQGCLERLESERGLSPDLREAMGQIVTQSERAAAIVEHYRRLIRKRPPARVPSNVNALVVAALDLTRAEARQSGVAVRTDLDQSLPPVLCDEIEIEQALVNLIKNALEAMASVPREGHELAIRTGRGEGGRVLVSVRDTGPGPAEADLERLFEPFFTTRAGGLGMGLPISRSIIEAHGGRLWASRGPDGGAEFQFTLPADNGATAADHKPTLSGQR